MMDTLSLQAWLKAHGNDPGPIDGKWGAKTQQALRAFGGWDAVKQSHKGLYRIVMHWTAGGPTVSDIDREHYHFVVDHAGNVVECNKPEINIDTSDGRYCAHTRALNTGSIGPSMAGMGGATHSPFEPGRGLTFKQVSAFTDLVADLADNYRIPVSPWTVLTHAEVQPTLGVRQNGKWDITWLPGMPGPADPVAVGDMLRSMM